MRASFLFLLAALLCGLVAVCVAGDQPRQSSSSRFESMSGIVLPDDVGLAVSDPAAWDRLRRDSARDETVTCYTVQSYRVKRQSPDSDVVEPAGYSTCQRASKYGVKKAVDSEKAR
jgi:hypothetical protein